MQPSKALFTLTAVGLIAASFAGSASGAAPDEVRAAFERFVAAQNDHDAKGVDALLAPDLLWITRGRGVWGHSEALNRFRALYKGTWKLEPVMSDFKLVLLNGDCAQLFVPVDFTIGAAGQPAGTTRFLFNQT